MYKLYWIKYSNYTNPYEEGYIGITSQSIEKRFTDHKYNLKNKHLRNRCKQNDVEVVCLVDDLSKEDAKILEEQYRPHNNIGWNINKGGDLPPSRSGKISPKSLLIGDNRTDAQKEGSKRASEKLKGNTFSSNRKYKVNRIQLCENCNKEFDNNYNKRKRFCSIKCAVETRNQNQEYLNKLSEATRKNWQDQDYKHRLSGLIKIGRNKS